MIPPPMPECIVPTPHTRWCRPSISLLLLSMTP